MSCSEGGCCGVQAVVVEFMAVAVELGAVAVEFMAVAVEFVTVAVEFMAIVVRFRGVFYVILRGFYAFRVTFRIVSCIIRVFRNVATCVKRQGYDSILKVHR